MSYTQFVHNHDSSDPECVYIGRPGPWGNPFRVTNAAARENAVRKYAAWLLDQGVGAPTPTQVMTLAGKHLNCYCAPKLCHGHVLACIANLPNGVRRVATWLGMELEDATAMQRWWDNDLQDAADYDGDDGCLAAELANAQHMDGHR